MEKKEKQKSKSPEKSKTTRQATSQDEMEYPQVSTTHFREKPRGQAKLEAAKSEA